MMFMMQENTNIDYAMRYLVDKMLGNDPRHPADELSESFRLENQSDDKNPDKSFRQKLCCF